MSRAKDFLTSLNELESPAPTPEAPVEAPPAEAPLADAPAGEPAAPAQAPAVEKKDKGDAGEPAAPAKGKADKGDKVDGNAGDGEALRAQFEAEMAVIADEDKLPEWADEAAFASAVDASKAAFEKVEPAFVVWHYFVVQKAKVVAPKEEEKK